MAIVTSPLYPGPDVVVTVTDDAAASGQDYQVLLLTSVPPKSELAVGIQYDPTETAPTSATDAAEREIGITTFTPDTPGEYGVTVIGFRIYPGDQLGERRHELVSSTSGTAEVGAYVRLPLKTADARGADLRLLIAAATVRGAELVDFSDDAARVAALDATTVAALATCVGLTATTLGTALQSGVDDLLAKAEAHYASVASVHSTADTTNLITRGSTDSQADAIDLLNQLRTSLVGHFLDSTAAGASNWHQVDEDDGENVPVTPPARDLAGATVLSAELRERCYERHRVLIATPASHGAADATNALAGPSKLDLAIVAYLDALVAATATAPTGEPDGAEAAVLAYGFTRES